MGAGWKEEPPDTLNLRPGGHGVGQTDGDPGEGGCSMWMEEQRGDNRRRLNGVKAQEGGRGRPQAHTRMHMRPNFVTQKKDGELIGS